MEIIPYLNFNGTCAEAFGLYERVLGGKMAFMQTHGESPMKEHVPADWHGKVLHAHLVFNGSAIMGSDVPPSHFQRPQGMAVNVMLPSYDEARNAFTALAEGGTVGMPFQKTFWSSGFGMVTDRFGTPWMVNCAQPA